MATHTCPTCGRDDFGREVDMKAHHTIAHGESLVHETDPRECPLCGESFANVGGMRAHHSIVHAESIAESRSLSKSVRDEVIERDGLICQRCQREVTPQDKEGLDFELHHIIPFSAGGPNHPDNLVTLCTDCHGTAHQELRKVVEEKPEIIDQLRNVICGSGD